MSSWNDIIYAEWSHDINYQSTLVPNLPDFFSQDGGLKSNNTAKLIKSATKRKYDYTSIPDRVKTKASTPYSSPNEIIYFIEGSTRTSSLSDVDGRFMKNCEFCLVFAFYNGDKRLIMKAGKKSRVNISIVKCENHKQNSQFFINLVPSTCHSANSFLLLPSPFEEILLS